MTDQCFDIACIRHVCQRGDGITHLTLMNGMQFQELLNGFSSPVDAIMEKYKSFIRYANLCLYFSFGQSTKNVGMLHETPQIEVFKPCV